MNRSIFQTDHAEHYDAVMSTPANWNAQLPYYSAYGEKKVNLSERMRRAKEEKVNLSEVAVEQSEFSIIA
jgi:hypothetical protein